MTKQEFEKWQTITQNSKFRWTEDEIYRLNGRGAFYYHGGEDVCATALLDSPLHEWDPEEEYEYCQTVHYAFTTGVARVALASRIAVTESLKARLKPSGGFCLGHHIPEEDVP